MNFKMNRLGRFATAALATAMLAGAMATSAFAAEPTLDSDKSFTIAKKIEVSDHVAAPKVEVDFEIKAAQPKADGSEKIGGTPVSAGTADSDVIVETKPSFDGTETATNGVYSKDVTFKVTKTYSKAGIYKYTVREKGNKVEGLADDKNTYTLYVFVENVGNACEVKHVELAKADFDKNGKEVKVDAFENIYKEEGNNPDAQLGHFDLTKTITGDQAVMTEEFEFTVNVSGTANDTKWGYEVTKNGTAVANKSGWITIDRSGDNSTKNDATLTIKLADNEKLTVYGLSEHDKVTVTETKANDDGYETKISGALTKDGGGSSGAQEVVDAKGKQLTYTNNRESVTPTGIVMNVAPYATMIAVAVAGCFVFLRRRREDQ